MIMRPVLASVPCLLALLSAPAVEPPGRDREVFAMGTRLKIHLEGAAPTAISENIIAEIGRIEAACSTWRPGSAWSRLNAAGGQPVPLATEWIHLLARAKEWSEKTQGAFDPVLMALLEAWGTRSGGKTPDRAEQTRSLAASGRDQLVLDNAAGTARLLDPGAGIEEGAFLKGFALDAAHLKAKAFGNRKGWLDFGGQILAWGSPLEVEIADPVKRQVRRASLRLLDASLSTSGCSERGRHLLDPRTGIPCAAWGSVSVVAPFAFDADVLSTALYVLGPDEGLAWAQQRRVAALFLLNNGAVRMSPEFAALRPTLLPGETE